MAVPWLATHRPRIALRYFAIHCTDYFMYTWVMKYAGLMLSSDASHYDGLAMIDDVKVLQSWEA